MIDSRGKQRGYGLKANRSAHHLREVGQRIGMLAIATLFAAAPAAGQPAATGITISNQTKEVQSCRVRAEHSDWSGYQSIAADFAIAIPASAEHLYYVECQPPAKAGVYAARAGDHYALRTTGKAPAVLQKIAN